MARRVRRPEAEGFLSEASPCIHVSAGASALLADALAQEPCAQYVRICVGRGWSDCSYRLALDESAGEGDVVIEAAGLRFLAERVQLTLVTELRLDVETCRGTSRLVASHPVWTAPGRC